MIQLLLPLYDDQQQPFPANHFELVRHELTERFGGVTAFVRSPAVGLWKKGAEVNRDEVVMFEVLAKKLDEDYWSAYRQTLADRFQQDEVLVWATSIVKL